jgi:hypothetical protein
MILHRFYNTQPPDNPFNPDHQRRICNIANQLNPYNQRLRPPFQQPRQYSQDKRVICFMEDLGTWSMTVLCHQSFCEQFHTPHPLAETNSRICDILQPLVIRKTSRMSDLHSDNSFSGDRDIPSCLLWLRCTTKMMYCLLGRWLAFSRT